MNIRSNTSILVTICLFIFLVGGIWIISNASYNTDLIEDADICEDLSMQNIEKIEIKKENLTKVITGSEDIKSVTDFLCSLKLNDLYSKEDINGWIFLIDVYDKNKNRISVSFNTVYTGYNNVFYRSDASYIKKLDDLFIGLNEE